MIKLVPEIRHFFRMVSILGLCLLVSDKRILEKNLLKAKNETANQKIIKSTHPSLKIRIMAFSNNQKFCLKVHISIHNLDLLNSVLQNRYKPSLKEISSNTVNVFLKNKIVHFSFEQFYSNS